MTSAWTKKGHLDQEGPVTLNVVESKSGGSGHRSDVGRTA